MLALAQAAHAGGSIECSGVSASAQHFRSASWVEYYGARGADDEIVISNNTDQPILFQYWTDGPSTLWTTIAPLDSKSLTVNAGTSVIRTKCELHPVSVPVSNTPSQPAKPAPAFQVVVAPPAPADPVIDMTHVPIDPSMISVQQQEINELHQQAPATQITVAAPAPSLPAPSPGGGLFPDPYADPSTITLPVLQPGPDPANDPVADPANDPSASADPTFNPDDFGGIAVDVAPVASDMVVLDPALMQQILDLVE